jgi:hypothetical protein
MRVSPGSAPFAFRRTVAEARVLEIEVNTQPAL